MQLQLAPLIGASTRGGGEGARLYTAMAAVTVMFSPHREINGTVLDHRLHAPLELDTMCRTFSTMPSRLAETILRTAGVATSAVAARTQHAG